MALIEVSVIPLGTGTPSVSQYVARAVEVLKAEKNIKYELTGMGTIVEGDLDQLLALISKMHKAVADTGVMRIVSTVRIDDRRDKPHTFSGKLESLKRKLGEQKG